MIRLSDGNKDKVLLVCDDWQTGRRVPTFRRAMTLSSGLEHEGSGTLVTVYQIIQRHTPENSIFNIIRAFQSF